MTTTVTDLSPKAYEAMRHAMVASQLRPNAVNDPRVVVAMAKIPRERFVPEDVRDFAYLDRAVPLGRGRHINTPVSTGRLLTEALLEPDDRVLLIGAAGGYAAAVLSELVGHVVAVESDPILVASARDALAGNDKVEIVEADLRAGAPDRGPYDLMIIDGAVEAIPDALLAQLKPDARVAAGLVDKNVTRLASGRRSPGGFGLVAFADMECVPLPGFERPRGFVF